jgi:hypothetical protein
MYIIISAFVGFFHKACVNARYGIHKVAFVMTICVLCEVETEFLNILYLNLRL